MNTEPADRNPDFQTREGAQDVFNALQSQERIFVHRSDGTVDGLDNNNVWQVYGERPYQDGQGVWRIEIRSRDGISRISKHVPVEKLYGWQTPQAPSEPAQPEALNATPIHSATPLLGEAAMKPVFDNIIDLALPHVAADRPSEADAEVVSHAESEHGEESEVSADDSLASISDVSAIAPGANDPTVAEISANPNVPQAASVNEHVESPDVDKPTGEVEQPETNFAAAAWLDGEASHHFEVLDRLTSLVDDREQLVSAIDQLVSNEDGQAAIDAMPSLIAFGAEPQVIIDVFVDHARNKKAEIKLIARNLTRFESVKPGAAVRIIDQLGSQLKDYFSDPENVADFIRYNRDIYAARNIREAMAELGVIYDPNPDGFFGLYGPIVPAGGTRYIVVDRQDDGIARDTAPWKDVDTERAALIFQPLSSANRKPSPTLIGRALQRLQSAVQHDASLRRLVGEYAQSHNIDNGDAMILALRADAGLRLAVGRHLFDSVNFLATFTSAPERIRTNSSKSIDTTRYPSPVKHATSREYAAMLALAMLDGSFDDEAEVGGTGRIGEHRTAAMMILGLK